MANYCCATRTNYFKVKNEKKFLDFMNNVQGSEDNIQIWTKELNGIKYFAFGCYGGIAGWNDTDDEDYDWDNAYDFFVDGLGRLVADDDAIIIFESGNEKLRYLRGDAMIITNTGTVYVNINDVATRKASELLANPKWSTMVAC